MKILMVTVSYGPDFERCKLLVETANRYVEGISGHVIIPDRADLPMFSPLCGGRVFAVPKEDLLPRWIKKMPLSKHWWWSSNSLPVRGWILQQIVKLCAAEQLDADAFLFVDSDVAFVRPFEAAKLIRQETSSGDLSLRMYRDIRKPHFYSSKRYQNWYEFAAKSLSLGDPNRLKGAYIAQLATWRKDHVLEMLKLLEESWSKPWQQYLIGHSDYSEYILYGAFVEELDKQHGHFFDDQLLCHSSWYYDVNSIESITQFLADMAEHQSAVHLQSNLNFSPTEYKELVSQLFE